ncbi:twin-arginine translocase subunit TatC [Hydrogenovibrio halophilus]|uniref:twin-arginine translocase subunit TatC n=1 Tax=Hydrogenovibrio halophilus TaxID=373391 RepID=UPI000373EFA9|nr:twin-arginine translocase subunit TatC [Hydrogenovibrio halophilus]
MSDGALPPQDKEMSLVHHLLDLRNAVTKAVLAILVLFIALFPFANDLYIYISEPLSRFLPEGTSMIATGVASPFLTPFKLSLVLAIYLAMPYLLYQIWWFIAPALYQHEKRLIGPLLFFSSFLFYAGGLFAYYVVFPLVFGFLSTAAPEGVTVATDIALYLDFVIKMFFAFGLAFEVPIVVVLLIITGMTSPEKMAHARPYIVVAAFVLGMLLTPPDIVSQTLLAIPVWLLYEAGVIIGGMIVKARRKNEDEDETDGNDDRSQPTSDQQANTKTEPEFDDRYADQLDDDWDDSEWDDAFEKIDAEFDALEKDQSKRQRGDSDKPDDDESPKK